MRERNAMTGGIGPPDEVKCSECQRVLAADAFSRSQLSKGGGMQRCEECKAHSSSAALSKAANDKADLVLGCLTAARAPLTLGEVTTRVRTALHRQKRVAHGHGAHSIANQKEVETIIRASLRGLVELRQVERSERFGFAAGDHEPFDRRQGGRGRVTFVSLVAGAKLPTLSPNVTSLSAEALASLPDTSAAGECADEDLRSEASYFTNRWLPNDLLDAGHTTLSAAAPSFMPRAPPERKGRSIRHPAEAHLASTLGSFSALSVGEHAAAQGAAGPRGFEVASLRVSEKGGGTADLDLLIE